MPAKKLNWKRTADATGAATWATEEASGYTVTKQTRHSTCTINTPTRGTFTGWGRLSTALKQAEWYFADDKARAKEARRAAAAAPPVKPAPIVTTPEPEPGILFFRDPDKTDRADVFVKAAETFLRAKEALELAESELIESALVAADPETVRAGLTGLSRSDLVAVFDMVDDTPLGGVVGSVLVDSINTSTL